AAHAAHTAQAQRVYSEAAIAGSGDGPARDDTDHAADAAGAGVAATGAANIIVVLAVAAGTAGPEGHDSVRKEGREHDHRLGGRPKGLDRSRVGDRDGAGIGADGTAVAGRATQRGSVDTRTTGELRRNRAGVGYADIAGRSTGSAVVLTSEIAV